MYELDEDVALPHIAIFPFYLEVGFSLILTFSTLHPQTIMHGVQMSFVDERADSKLRTSLQVTI